MKYGLRAARPLAFGLALLAACGPAPAPVAPPPPPPQAVRPPAHPVRLDLDPEGAARIAADVRTLASPELDGRGTGTPGARAAAELVAHRFAELGLRPLGGGTGPSPEAGYFQEFRARVGAKVGPTSLAAKAGAGAAQRWEGGAVVAAEGSASLAEGAPVEAVFAGYGITAQAVGWDDYAGADLTGKVVVVLDGVPHLTDKRAEALHDFGSARYKLRTAREHHAAAVVLLGAAAELPPPPSDASSMGIAGIVALPAVGKRLLAAAHLDDRKAREAQQAGKPVSLGKTRLAVATSIEPVDAPAWNILGLLPARGAPTGPEVAPGARRPDDDDDDDADRQATEFVVVGAHYDHLGHGGTSASLAPGSHEIHPGADDNASGTALMLEVARRLARMATRPARNVLFMGFGAEELGVLGSRHWVEHPTVPLASVVAMLNADMVGRLREKHLVVDGTATAAGWPALIQAAATGLDLDLAFGAEGFGASDHASFTEARVPVAFFFTGVHPDYHRPSDTADKINAEGENRIATLAARLALEVAEQPERMAFADAPADPHRSMRAAFKVSLGTMPDYAYQGKGMRLSGVRPDSPAARAGLTGGDVILKVGSHDITNIHDYMFALSELEAGSEVVITVDRGGAQVSVKAIPAPGR